MPSQVKKPLFGKLLARYGIAQGESPTLFMGDTITPIVDADPLCGVLRIATITGTATSRDDIFTVPAGKLWKIHAWGVSRSNAGDLQLYVGDPTNVNMQIAPLQAAAAINGGMLSLELFLSTGWTWRMQNGSGTSGTISSFVLYEEFDN